MSEAFIESNVEAASKSTTLMNSLQEHGSYEHAIATSTSAGATGQVPPVMPFGYHTNSLVDTHQRSHWLEQFYRASAVDTGNIGGNTNMFREGTVLYSLY